MALQPLLMGRWYAMRRAQAIRAIEKEHGTRVITMIHRQERRSLFGFAVSRHIDLEDAQTVNAAIKDTPDDTPIDLIIHTPGGIVLAAMQIARAVWNDRATDLLEKGFRRYFWKSLFGTRLDGLAIQASLSDSPAHLRDSVCGVARAKSKVRRSVTAKLHGLDARGSDAPASAVSASEAN